MKRQLLLWSFTSALAGFLFGFDTVVISGSEQKIQEVWNLGSVLHGLTLSAALWGTVLGALFGGLPTDKLGRKKTLIGIGVLYLVSAVGSALAPDAYTMMAMRFIGGLGIGISTVASPLFIAEIAPSKFRGRLAGLFQFNIVFGILIAFVSNYLIGRMMPEAVAWRWMLGIEAIPAAIYSILCFSLPESPRWLLVHRNDRSAAAEIFKQVEPDQTSEEIDQLIDSVLEHRDRKTTKESFFSGKLGRPISLAILIAFFNQVSGINAILYFAPRIFEWTGLSGQAALLQSVGIGITNLIFTFVGLYLIDRLGRKLLLVIGCFGYIGSLGLTAWAFSSGTYSIVPYCIFAFIASHAVGQGAVIWVFIGEIFPNEHRAYGQALGSFTHWFFAASITLVFPKCVQMFSPQMIFGFFCFMMIVQLVWIRLKVPETKGVSLEDMEDVIG